MSSTLEHQRHVDHDDAPSVAARHSNSDRELVGRAITINRPASELYAYWRDFSNLATFMENIVRIDVTNSEHSHWVVKAPGGKTVEWDAIVTHEVDGREINWRSAKDADVPNSGKVTFEDAGSRGTVVRAVIAYDPPMGGVGRLIAKMFQREPEIQARRDLRRFKQLMETGEIAVAANTRAAAEEERDA
jgi:uncharacterized membrane protein